LNKIGNICTAAAHARPTSAHIKYNSNVNTPIELSFFMFKLLHRRNIENIDAIAYVPVGE
jgi:hypothetical protein